MQPGRWVLTFPQRCHLPGMRKGCDMQGPRGTPPWQWRVLTSRHKGPLPVSASSEAVATVGSTGNRRALSLGLGSPGPFMLLLRRGPELSCHGPTMLRTLGLALLALLSTVGPSQASGFTGEGSGLGEGDAGGAGGLSGSPSHE